MIIYGLIYLAFLLYFSLAYGTYLKFRKNQIVPIGIISKVKVMLLPIILFIVHTLIALGSVYKNPKFSLFVMKKFFLDYPEILGVFIEVTLEKLAFNIALEHKNEQLTTNKRIRKLMQGKESKINDFNHNTSTQVLKRYKSILSTA